MHSRWAIESVYTNCGVTSRTIVSSFASRAAAERFADRWNANARANAGGMARVIDQQPRIEAYGNKGLKNTPWRKAFKNAEAMLKWAEKNDATIEATRDVEG